MISNVLTILKQLKDLGISLNINGGRIILRPGSAIPQGLKSKITKLGPDLLQLLSNSNNGPIIWNGTTSEYRSLLILRQAELEIAKAKLTGDSLTDWWVNNHIARLERHISDLKRWLAHARGKGE